MKTPVAFFIFNRPDTTAKVFEAIRNAKPPKLLVIADGPRSGRLGESEKCQTTREIIKRVDWKCEVLTNYSNNNLGCRTRVSTGLNWAFEQVDEAIILEDDCLPHPSFFRYCEKLLEHYRHDTRVMTICGNNYIDNSAFSRDSYYFSRDSHCWGWACWKRSWQHYDDEMKLWLEIKNNGWLKNIFHDRKTAKYWEYILQLVYDEEINSWAYRWMLSCWLQSGLTILPNINLVSNIGHGKGATNTTKIDKLSNMKTSAIEFPLKHPDFMIRVKEFDDFTQSYRFGVSSLNLLKMTLIHLKLNLIRLLYPR